MALHRNARLGLAGRRALVADVESGCSCREAARRRGVSPTTACKWWSRWREASVQQRRLLICLEDRSSRPHRSPRRLPATRAGADLRGAASQRLGAETDRGRDRLPARDRLAGVAAGRDLAATAAAARACPALRVALSRRSAPHRQQTLRPLHASWPRRHRRSPANRRRAADAGRLRVCPLTRRRPLALCLQRAPPRRTSSDRQRLPRARPRRLRQTGDRGEAADERQRLDLHPQPGTRRTTRQPRHPPSPDPPRRPQVNGKVERYQQTLKREWALGQIYRSSDHRAQALSHWLIYYNERRPHSSLGGQSPISRVHNVPRQDT